MSTVLITGGTGLIGQHLSALLIKKGYKIRILTRNINQDTNTAIEYFYWKPEEETIDLDAFKNVKAIIHLAGEPIANKRWTIFQKKKIIDSRVQTAALLFKSIFDNNLSIESFISASGVGYYDSSNFLKKQVESNSPGNDFLAKTCVLWENAANQFSKIGIRTVKLRTGVVLTPEGGVLKKFNKIINLNIGSTLGSGQQKMAWIHIEDLCHLYLKAVEDTKIEGSYNACAPEVVTNHTFTKVLAASQNKTLWVPSTPSWVLKIIFGEMSDLLLLGSSINSEKIQKRGFQFQYPSLDKALSNLK